MKPKNTICLWFDKDAQEAARFAKVPGLSLDTARKLDILRSSIVLPAPQKAGCSPNQATKVR